MFEEIEKATDGRAMILSPQNHPKALLSFVWDATAGDDAEASAAPESAE